MRARTAGNGVNNGWTKRVASVFRFWQRFRRRPRPPARLYTRAGCGLCDEAAQLLRDEGWQVESVDIDTDPDLTKRYSLLIPVVEINGRERFRGRVNRVLLRRIRRREFGKGSDQ